MIISRSKLYFHNIFTINFASFLNQPSISQDCGAEAAEGGEPRHRRRRDRRPAARERAAAAHHSDASPTATGRKQFLAGILGNHALKVKGPFVH